MAADGDSSEPIDPAAVDLTATEPVFAGLGETAEAADEVVRAVVVDLQPGRTLTDPQRPDAGIVTEYVQLDVVAGVGADVPAALVVEQEATLLDGTPVTVNGAAPLDVGNEGVAFVRAGPGGGQPFHALVATWAWIPIVDSQLAPRSGAPSWLDRWRGRSPADLFDAVSDSR